MITENHQVLIREAVLTKNKATIDAAFQKVLHEEIGGIKRIDNVTQNYFCELATLLVIPYRQEIRIDNDRDSNESLAKDELKWGGICLLVLICITIISSEFGKLFGICLSVVGAGALYYYLRLNNAKNKVKPKRQEYTVIQIVEEDILIDLANKFVCKIRNLVDKFVNQEKGPVEAIQLPLHECYPNVLKWLQNLYSDSLDFDDKTKEYLLKRIVKIVDSCYYDIILFNKETENMFEINVKEDREKPHMVSPALIYSKTGKVILPGIVFMSKNKY